MSQILGFSNLPEQASLPLQFVIVGGGITGLAAAIALRRVGHNVMLFEKDATLTETSGACRMPPNLSKILYHWGLAEHIGDVTGAIDIFIQETGELLGSHTWEEEILQETRGDYVFAHMGQLRQLLHKIAVAAGTEIHLGTPVKTIDSENGVVTLYDGELIQGDVILGCDGHHGITRQSVMEANDETQEEDAQIDLNVYSVTVPHSAILEDKILRPLFADRETPTLFTWFGDQHAVLGIPIRGPSSTFEMYAYCPRDSNQAIRNEQADMDGLASALQNSDPMLQRLAALATRAKCTCVDGRPPLNDWVDNKLVLLGASVHAMPAGSIQECALAVEDGAVLAKLFSHLYSKEQIQSFLYAFQDIRIPRCATIYQQETGIVQYMTVPPGDFREKRDDTMRAKRDAGKGILETVGDLEEPPQWVMMKDVFGFDAEDEADDWWVQWGLLRERARITSENGAVHRNSLFSDVTVSHSVEY